MNYVKYYTVILEKKMRSLVTAVFTSLCNFYFFMLKLWFCGSMTWQKKKLENENARLTSENSKWFCVHTDTPTPTPSTVPQALIAPTRVRCGRKRNATEAGLSASQQSFLLDLCFFF